MEKKRIYPEQTPPQNIPYSSANKKLPFSYIVPEDDSIVIEQDANGVLYISNGIKKVATPVLSVDGDTITASCATEGAEIHFTRDGSAPSYGSETYTHPLVDSSGTGTYRFVALKNGMVNSDEATCHVTTAYFRFSAVANNSSVSMTSNNSSAPNLQVSRDAENWSDWNSSEINGVFTFDTIPLYTAGDTVYVRGENDALATSTSVYSSFVLTGRVKAAGEIARLLGENSSIEECAFTHLFRNCSALSSAENIVFDNRLMSDYCFYGMFENCTSIELPPALPSVENLSDYCCAAMFKGCTSLMSTPQFSAIYHAESCYAFMFKNCSSLVEARGFPISSHTSTNSCEQMFAGCVSLKSKVNFMFVNLAQGCCYSMFAGCISIKEAEIVYDSVMEEDCFRQMFYGCERLSDVKSYISDWNPNYSVDWLKGVSKDGTFTKSVKATGYVTGDSCIPDNWTVIDE